MKSRYFGDEAGFQSILRCESPRRAKNIGKHIKNFNPEAWDKMAETAMLTVLRHKFHQNRDAGQALLALPSYVLLAEASSDNRWGIGLAFNHPKAGNPNSWRGRNRLGVLLHKVKTELYLYGCVMFGQFLFQIL